MSRNFLLMLLALLFAAAVPLVAALTITAVCFIIGVEPVGAASFCTVCVIPGIAGGFIFAGTQWK